MMPRLEERERARMERRRPFVRVLKWTALGLAGVLILGAVPGYLWLRDWRAGNLARQAEVMLVAQDAAVLAEAWEKARAAARLRPGDLEVLRIVARVADRAAPLEAPESWAQVLEQDGATAADHLGAIEAALRLRDLVGFRAGLAQAREAGWTGPEFRRLEAQGAASTGDWPRARAEFEALVEATAAPEDFALLANVLVQSPRAEDRERARGVRWSLAARDEAGEVRLAQRRALAEGAFSSTERQEQLIRWLLDEPAREDRLQGLSLQLRLDPGATEEIYAQARGWFELEDLTERVALGRWLNRHGLQRFTIRLIPTGLITARQDLFLVYVDALAMAGGWEELQEVLNQVDLPLDPYLEHLFRMRVRLQQGETRRARIEWERALLEAGSEPDKVLFLVRYVHRLGLEGFTLEALERLAGFPATMRLGLQTILVLEERAQRTEAVWSTLARLAELDPDDHAVANDWAYYALLLETEMDRAREQAAELETRFPELLAPKMTRALGMVRAGEWQLADQYLGSLPVNWPEVSARWRTLLAAVWAQNGRQAEARALIADVAYDSLLPEERAIIADALN